MIAYFKGKSFVSRLIKWRTWGKYSHVAWIVSPSFDWSWLDPEGAPLDVAIIYESWHRKAKGAKRAGVRKGVAGDLHKPGTVVDLYIVKVDLENYHLGIELAENVVNDPKAKYDFRGAISGFVLRKDSAHGRRAVVCSRFCMWILDAMGIRFLINIEDYQTSPMDMAHSPAQRFVGTWKTGTPFPKIDIPEGWH